MVIQPKKAVPKKEGGHVRAREVREAGGVKEARKAGGAGGVREADDR